MKNFFKSLMCLAVVAMAFTACQKEEEASLPKTLKLTVDAVAEELASDARTYIDNSNNILWGKGEQMTIVLMDAKPQFVSSTPTDEFDGLAKATFAFEITPGENSTYTYGGVYPTAASKGITNEYADAYKVLLPSTQKATATSYDPSAYIMLAKPIVANEAQTSLQMSYGRITALNKITLTGLNADVKSVTITLPDGQNFAGRRYLDLTQGSVGDVYYGQTPSITVDYDTALTGASKDVWFTSWEAAVAAGEQMTIKATTATHSYTRTITANSNGISFKEGHLNTLSVNMAAGDVVVESLADYSGSYLIVAELSGVYYAMSVEASGSRRKAKVLEGYTAFADAAYPTNDASIKWTVSKSGDGYTISNGDQYLAWVDGNNATLSDEPYLLKIVQNNDFETFKITSAATPARILGKNSNVQYEYFAFYTSDQANKLYLKEFVADTRTALTTPSVTAEAQDSSSIVASWNAITGAANYTVTCGSSAPVVVEGTTHTFTNLDPETDYTISVVANPVNLSVHKPSAAGTDEATTKAAAVDRKVLTFPFTSAIPGWPSATKNSNGHAVAQAANYTYTLNGVDYSFYTSKNGSSSSGFFYHSNGLYLATLSSSQGEALGLPAIPGYKLIKVEATNTSGCSAYLKVGITDSPSSASYIDGGSYQTWEAKSSTYTYVLTNTIANTVYYMYFTSANGQLASITLTYEAIQ